MVTKLSLKLPAWQSLLLILALLASACQPASPAALAPVVETPTPTPLPEGQVVAPTMMGEGTEVAPQPTRPAYQPGQLVEYTVQTGDTLPMLAVRFNTNIEEIREANPIIPQDVTTLPPGMPMQIPIYYLPLWGSPYRILPDSLFINGPAQVSFNTSEFVNSQPGWLKGYKGFASGQNHTGAEIVDLAARNYSVSPRLLLALLEFHSGALSQPAPPEGLEDYPLGYISKRNKGLTAQLSYVANQLNDNYYQYRMGNIKELILMDGSLERPDPWQNAATVALQLYFSRFLEPEAYRLATSEQGFAAIYARLFGDPWASDQPHIPGSLVQPEFRLPFEPGTTWALTGGPHTAWGNDQPWAALDFAPPTVVGGCTPTDEWTTAVASGLVVRSETGIVVLDLDQDGDERTGWVVFHLHVGTEGRAPVGKVVEAGQPIGHPSCEGGKSTGTHVHIARKYNGEWVPAAGVLPFVMEGWVPVNGFGAYAGGMKRNSQEVTACTCSNSTSWVTAGR